MRLEPLHSIFKWVIIGILWWPLVFLGCEKGAGTTRQDEMLIRVGDGAVTADDFHKAFDQTASNYSAALFRDQHALQDAKYRLLNQLTDELILLERAKELQLFITPVELGTAVDGFKKDFPEGQFEKTLFESGIGFADWQDSLEKRLLMEKVVTKEFKTIDDQTETAYADWMNELKKKYTVTINWSLWETIYEPLEKRENK